MQILKGHSGHIVFVDLGKRAPNRPLRTKFIALVIPRTNYQQRSHEHIEKKQIYSLSGYSPSVPYQTANFQGLSLMPFFSAHGSMASHPCQTVRFERLIFSPFLSYGHTSDLLPLFKVQPTLPLPNVSMVSDSPHPGGLLLKNTLLFFFLFLQEKPKANHWLYNKIHVNPFYLI